MSTAGQLVIKYQYLSCTKENKKWCWEQKHQQQVIVVRTCTTLHPCTDVILVKGVQDMPIGVWNINQELQDLQRHTICLTRYGNDYIIGETLCGDKIEHEININIEDDAE